MTLSKNRNVPHAAAAVSQTAKRVLLICRCRSNSMKSVLVLEAATRPVIVPLGATVDEILYSNREWLTAMKLAAKMAQLTPASVLKVWKL